MPTALRRGGEPPPSRFGVLLETACLAGEPGLCSPAVCRHLAAALAFRSLLPGRGSITCGPRCGWSRGTTFQSFPAGPRSATPRSCLQRSSSIAFQCSPCWTQVANLRAPWGTTRNARSSHRPPGLGSATVWCGTAHPRSRRFQSSPSWTEVCSGRDRMRRGRIQLVPVIALLD